MANRGPKRRIRKIYFFFTACPLDEEPDEDLVFPDEDALDEDLELPEEDRILREVDPER